MTTPRALQPLARLPPAGQPPLRVNGVHGLGVAYVAVSARRLHPARPVILVTPDEESADEAARDVRFLLGCAGDAASGERVLRFPGDERGPYAEQSPDSVAIMDRVAALFAFATDRAPAFLVVSAAAASRRTVPVRALQRYAQLLVTGEQVGREPLLQALSRSGYTPVSQVEEVGTFAVRGGIVDVYAAGEPWPVRVDLFGDEVESLKYFDPETQRTRPDPPLKEWSFGPAREVVFDTENVARAKGALRDLADRQDIPTRQVSQHLADIDAGIPFFGIEGFVPAFYPPGRPSLLRFLAENGGANPPVLVTEDSIACGHALRAAHDEFLQAHERARSRGRMAFPPDDHTATPDELERDRALLPRVELERLNLIEAGPAPVELKCVPTRDLRNQIVARLKGATAHQAEEHGHHASAEELLEPLVLKAKALRSARVATFLVAETLGGVERLKELLDGHGLGVRVVKQAPDVFDEEVLRRWFDPSVHAWILQGRPHAPSRGAEFPDLGVAFISEEEIFGKRAQRGPKHRSAFKTSLSDLEPGDYVVHVDHGVGTYRGLVRLALRGVEADYLHLEYAGQDKLYLPVTRINLIQRYAGADTAKPRLDKLGGTGWENAKQRVKKAILAMAGELLNLYARRELATGQAYPEPDAMFREFEAEFAFEETADQQKAIDDCLKDLQRGKPMDRLVCGDVGYGKTEVALRAAMLVALASRQVCVLAPTTVLAQQHYYTFRERMKNYPVRIEVVSSFRATREVKQVLQRLKEGQVDVIIGTHRLLNPDVAFKDLGLVVVDEEHRFGVAHKERLKQLKTASHVLTLTATPIPRTLQMSFFGVRDLSLIQTPPVDRRSVRTTLARFSEEDIRETMLRELRRGGQVYFVHNRVQSIHAMRDFLQRLVPEARIGVGHGQMEGHDLEEVMVKFINRELNVLLCTTIIESGIDIPTANTIIINRADRMGLAQLHQLRGRVGRSSERGYALLLIPPSTQITAEAKSRLEALQKFTDLGAGFQVAQHDLELRGAGELLGKQQHGHVTAVGFEMYAELLAQAVQELKGRAGILTEHDAPDPEVNLPVRALVPDGFIPDVHERLSLYQKLATAKDSAAIYDEIGLVGDRYGEPPPEVLALAEVMVLKQKLREMHARALDVATPPPPDPRKGQRVKELPRPRTAEGAAAAGTRALDEGLRIFITLGEGARLDPARLTEWIAKDAQHRRLTPQMKLVYHPTPEELMAAGEDVTALCRRLLSTLLEVAAPHKGARAATLSAR
ncbi:MAG: transcription-repair coupling factor [Deltaproteobacteria bacterium]|nr:transcription-repair coupling factor [Deltaproteobacteria bacterium]